MPNHITPDEQRRLDEIDAEIAPRKKERATILNRVRQRKHQSKLNPPTQR